jgi:hypothetical protein
MGRGGVIIVGLAIGGLLASGCRLREFRECWQSGQL